MQLISIPDVVLVERNSVVLAPGVNILKKTDLTYLCFKHCVSSYIEYLTGIGRGILVVKSFFHYRYFDNLYSHNNV